MSEWQPISTAPKDESKILTFAPEYGILINRWSAKHREWYTSPPAHEPTHWMPLPEAPVEASA
jgi:hypothetical protein